MLELLVKDIAASIAFGLIGICLIVLGFKALDKVTPKLDLEQELINKNMAVAVVVSSMIIGICYLASTTIGSIVAGK